MNSISPAMKRMLRLVWQVTIFGLVAWGITHSMREASNELIEQQFRLQDLRWSWVMVAAAAYAMGLLPMGWFWYRLLLRMGQPVRPLACLRAYFLGHLGKYVPGKVMVVVIRASALRSTEESGRVDGAIAALSVLIETLTMMASGAFLASASLLIWFPETRQLQGLAILIMCASTIATTPPVIRQLLRWLGSSRNDPQAVSLDNSFREMRLGGTIAGGWLACCGGWACLAISLFATARAIPGWSENAMTLIGAARYLATVCLAVVAGFVSLLPGGIGVREWVVDQMLSPRLGVGVAVTTAILLRVVWLLTELAISIILYRAPLRPRRIESSRSVS